MATVSDIKDVLDWIKASKKPAVQEELDSMNKEIISGTWEGSDKFGHADECLEMGEEFGYLKALSDLERLIKN